MATKSIEACLDIDADGSRKPVDALFSSLWVPVTLTASLRVEADAEEFNFPSTYQSLDDAAEKPCRVLNCR